MSGGITRKTDEKSPLLDKMRECWSKGCNDRETCYICGIDNKTYRGMLGLEEVKSVKKIDGLLEERELCRSNPSFMARTNIYSSLKKGNLETSKWYLERVNSDEFSPKVKNETELTVSTKSIDEKTKEMMDKLDVLIKK